MADEDAEREELWKLLDVLGSDVEAAGKAAKASALPTDRRTYIRAVFAQIEATVFLLKQDCLTRADGHEYSPAETSILREESYSLDNRGEATVQPRFVPLDQNFRFAFTAYTKNTLPGHALDCSGEDWRSFKDAIKIRNRITHPRHPDLLAISDAEFALVERVHGWYVKTFLTMLAACVRHLRAEREKREKLAAQTRH